jgi:hypothetical protein
MHFTLRRLTGALTAAAVTGGLLLTAPVPTATAATSDDPARTGLFGGQDPTFDGVYRQSLSLIALDAAGARVPRSAVKWLLRQQCPNGKFTSFRADLSEPCGAYDSNATALAVMALEAAGEGAAARTSLEWLLGKQLRSGGWEYSPGWGADASSTGYVVQAMVTMGVKPHSVARQASGPQYLRSVQLRCEHEPAKERGALTYLGAADAFSTVQATPALAGDALPVAAGTVKNRLPALTCPKDGDQPSAAAVAAGYLGRVIDDNAGTVPGFGGGPDYGNTANAVLSMVAAGFGAQQVDAAMTALEANAADYTRDDVDQVVPGAAALVVLAELATSGSPRDVDGLNLVRDLLSSRTRTG